MLVCGNCDTKVSVNRFGKSKITLHDATSHIDRHFDIKESLDVVHCKSCGGTEIVDSNATYGKCSFCDSSFVITEKKEGINVPKYMIPFKVTEEQALENMVDYSKGNYPLRFTIRKSVRSGKNTMPLFQPTWVFSSELTTTY